MSDPSRPSQLVLRHLQFGWWAIICFVVLGLALELMLGFKIDYYLNADYEVRRLMWRLAHAHGVLLGVVNVIFAVSMNVAGPEDSRRLRAASRCLMAATLLLPGSFFLGGFGLADGDPGIGVFLAPVGAVLMIVATVLAALEIRASCNSGERGT